MSAQPVDVLAHLTRAVVVCKEGAAEHAAKNDPVLVRVYEGLAATNEAVRSAVAELIEAASEHERNYTTGQRHNDEGLRYKATQRLRAALARCGVTP